MIGRVKPLGSVVSTKFGTNKQQSTNLVSKDSLWERLKRGADARTRFVESHLTKNLAFQIRALRDREDWSQGQLAEKVGMNQNAISRLENPSYGKATLTTLKRLAAAFDVALIVRFVPFGQLVDWASSTPRIDTGLSNFSLSPLSFQKELVSVEERQPSAAESGYPEKPPSVGTQLPLELLPGNVV